MNYMRRTLILAILLTVPYIAGAQFYTTGDDPASIKWYRTDTETYKIIYPEGLDSLALAYARALEHYKIPAGRSAGYTPGEWTCGRIPVILHAFNARSNGSVAWAPKRMDLFTSPQPYGSEPVPWTDMLAIHEQRHVAQMQAGLSGVFRPFGWVFGEMFNGLVAGIYPSTAFLEGDAVIAETALTRSGRGRTGDFLNYYMIAFDNGDFRSWNRWRFGSQRYYAPDHYAAGYFLLSGIRYVYDVPDFTAQYFHHIARRPYDFNAFRNTLKKTTGKKMNEVYREIADTMGRIWAAEIEERKPFISYSPIVKTPARYTEYSRNTALGPYLYSVRSGLTEPASLVRTGMDGETRRLRAFSSESGKFAGSPASGKIYWSETVPDARWSHRINSAIRYYDTVRGKTGTISRKGRMFNPSVSADGTLLATTEYKDDGRSVLNIMDAGNGKVLSSFAAPDSLQLAESVWMDCTDAGEPGSCNRIYVTGISSGGYGLYAITVPDRGALDSTGTRTCTAAPEWQAVLSPQPVKVINLDRHGNMLTFTSDRTGVSEFYHFDPEAGVLTQKTSTRYGADCFTYSPDGDTLYYSLKMYEGNIIVKTPSRSLMDRTVDFSDIHRYPVADRLSEQERELAYNPFSVSSRARKKSAAASRGTTYPDNRPDTSVTASPLPDSVSANGTPRRYRKFPNLFRIHSWAPVYFNVDRLRSFSFDHIYQAISLGAAGISQNGLGTAITQFGYSAHKDPYDHARWRHSGHLTFSYTGWYPVIEASVDFNDRASRQSIFTIQNFKGLPEYMSGSSLATDSPYVTGEISIYIPFNLSRGGWTSGLVPQVSYSISNDCVRTGYHIFNRPSVFADNQLVTVTPGKNVPVQTMSVSLRGYTMRPATDSGVYPRWGIGMEGGALARPWLEHYYSPMAYAYIYGYAPGIIPQHGVHFTALGQSVLNGKAVFATPAVNTLPQGLSHSTPLSSLVSAYSSQSLKLYLDYAIPIYIGDISIFGPFMYLKRLIITPYVDFSMFEWMESSGLQGSLFSAGASLTIDFERLFWLRFPFSVGLTYSCSGGSAFRQLQSAVGAEGASFGRHYVGPIFSVDF